MADCIVSKHAEAEEPATMEDRVVSQHAESASTPYPKFRVFYANAGQTQQMWRSTGAKSEYEKFAQTIEMIFVEFEADLVLLCALGHHSNGLADCKWTPMEVLRQHPNLMKIADSTSMDKAWGKEALGP